MPSDRDRVKTLFLAASDLLAADIPAYLDDRCGTDRELRAAVERLLAAHADPDSRIEHGPSPVGPFSPRSFGDAGTLGTRHSSDRSACHSVLGSVIAGRYTLVEVLGEGGMGTVFRADQTEPVKRQVALKLIRAGMDSRTLLARFDAERQALALMDHPNIARVYDGGTTPTGQPFFVMELVRGVPVTDYCDRKRLSVRERLELFVLICSAVQHAHQKSVIHRDLKPSNVLVSEMDGRPTPKVIDFGVAKATDQKLTDLSLADVGAIVGTPAYMSPEQADPTMDIDTRTDVYALGVILYELLAGSPPIGASTLKQAAIFEVLRMVREVEPPKPSTKVSSADNPPGVADRRSAGPDQLKRSLQGDLDWIVMKALEKDRTRRYETSSGLAADVLRHLANEPVLAAPPSWAYRTRKFVRKHRGPVAAAAVVLLLLVTGVAGTTVGLLRAEQARDAEADQRRAAEESEREARRAAEAEHAALEDANAARQKAVDAERATAASLAQERATTYAHRIALAQREWLANEVGRARQLLDDCPADLRHWEWRYLRRLCDTSVLAFRNARGGAPEATAYSLDGKRIAVPDGKDVSLRDAATGKELTRLAGKQHVVSGVSFADGGRVAVLRWKEVTVYAADGKPVCQFQAAANAIAIRPDGKEVATAGGDDAGKLISAGQVKVWDAETGKLIRTLGGLPHPATCVAYGTEGKTLAAGTGILSILAGGEDASKHHGLVRVWSANGDTVLHDLKGHTYWVLGVAFSRDGKRLASAGADGTVRVWDAVTGKQAHVLTGHSGWVGSVSFNRAGDVLASVGDDRLVRLWDPASGKEQGAIRGLLHPTRQVRFSPDGVRLLTASKLGDYGTEVRVWETTSDQQAYTDPDANGLTTLTFSADSLSFGWAGTNTAVVRPVPSNPDGITRGFAARGLVFGTDPALVATAGGGEGGVTLRSFGNWEAVQKFGTNFHPYKSAQVVLSPDRKLVTSVSEDKFSMWEAETGRLVRRFEAHRVFHTATAFSPDSTKFATVSGLGHVAEMIDGKEKTMTYQPELKVWDTASGELVRTLVGGGGRAVAWSPDGSRIAGSSAVGHTAAVWDARDGKHVLELNGHSGPVTSIAFSPDSRRIVTGSADHSLKLWDAASGQEILTLRGHPTGVVAVAFSPDGRYIGSGASELFSKGEAKLWDAGPPK